MVIIGLLLCSLLATLPAAGQEVEVRVGKGSSINWTRNVLYASGTSATPIDSRDRALRIAALDTATSTAAQNLMQAVLQVTIGSSATVEDAIRTDAALRQGISTLVRRFTITDTRAMSDMSVEVDLELPLTDRMAGLLLPDRTGYGAWRLDDIARSPLSLLPWPECREVPAGIELVIPSQGLSSYRGKAYTGLIIDARKIGVEPALLPRIVDEAGNEIYGPKYVTRESAVQAGLASYYSSLDAAKKDARAGGEPLVICGVRAEGKYPVDIAVSANDAVIIHAAAKTNNFLRQCRVIIVVAQ